MRRKIGPFWSVLANREARQCPKLWTWRGRGQLPQGVAGARVNSGIEQVFDTLSCGPDTTGESDEG